MKTLILVLLTTFTLASHAFADTDHILYKRFPVAGWARLDATPIGNTIRHPAWYVTGKKGAQCQGCAYYGVVPREVDTICQFFNFKGAKKYKIGNIESPNMPRHPDGSPTLITRFSLLNTNNPNVVSRITCE